MRLPENDNGGEPSGEPHIEENPGLALVERIDGICGLRAGVSGVIQKGRFENQKCYISKPPHKVDGPGRDPFGFASIEIRNTLDQPLLRVNIYSMDGKIQIFISPEGMNIQEPHVLVKDILDNFIFVL